jgi:hypothetical protein
MRVDSDPEPKKDAKKEGKKEERKRENRYAVNELK